jgi:hypothetical protein
MPNLPPIVRSGKSKEVVVHLDRNSAEALLRLLQQVDPTLFLESKPAKVRSIYLSPFDAERLSNLENKLQDEL